MFRQNDFFFHLFPAFCDNHLPNGLLPGHREGVIYWAHGSSIAPRNECSTNTKITQRRSRYFIIMWPHSKYSSIGQNLPRYYQDS
jgi:hypothetical protein